MMDKGIPPQEMPNNLEGEITPEDKQFITENPELSQISIIEGGAELIRNGQENNDPEKIEQGLEILNAAKEEILQPSNEDDKRTSKFKKVAGEIHKNFWAEHGLKAEAKDISTFIQEVKLAPKDEKLSTINQASIKLSKKQGIIHLINDIRRGLEK